MSSNATGLINFLGDNTWISLRSLTLVRWVAIAGQAAALVAAKLWLDLDLPYLVCAAIIVSSGMLNLIFLALQPRSYRLSAPQVVTMLALDLAQLAALIALTGGIHNPFALLFIAPATIAATTLQGRATALIACVTIALVTLVALVNLPLVTASGEVLTIPLPLEIGYWLAVVTGVAFLSLYARRVSAEIQAMASALMATQMALARSQKLTDLGAVVAAAAHELGTPLATIKLVSSEMIDALKEHPELDELQEDAALLASQADRCRDILRGMGRAGKEDLQMRAAPLEAVLREAAEPHLTRGKAVIFDIDDMLDDEHAGPEIRRAPEILHGLRNLIQNAVDFAQSTVWIDARWRNGLLELRISDDGPGYPPTLLDRIGDPFLKSRSDGSRPGYEGMGLGLFIAKSLLERSGATLTFTNGTDPFLALEERPDRAGAQVRLTWSIGSIAADTAPIGRENTLFTP